MTTTPDPIHLVLAPAPAGAGDQQTEYPYGYPCGCNLRDGFCSTHQPMIAEIHEAWRSGSNALCEAIWSRSDGYGEPGFVPSQGYDWSGIRDSSPQAIEAMWKVVHA